MCIIIVISRPVCTNSCPMLRWIYVDDLSFIGASNNLCWSKNYYKCTTKCKVRAATTIHKLLETTDDNIIMAHLLNFTLLNHRCNRP